MHLRHREDDVVNLVPVTINTSTRDSEGGNAFPTRQRQGLSDSIRQRECLDSGAVGRRIFKGDFSTFGSTYPVDAADVNGLTEGVKGVASSNGAGSPSKKPAFQ